MPAATAALPAAPSTIPTGTSALGAGGAGAWSGRSEQPRCSAGGAIAAGGETPFSSDPEHARRNQVLEPVTGNMSIAGVVGRAWLVTALTPPQGAVGELESTSTGDFDPYCCCAASLPGSDAGHRDAPFLSSGPGSSPRSGGAGHFPVSPNLEPSQ